MFKRFLIATLLIFTTIVSLNLSAGLTQNHSVVPNGYNFWLYTPSEVNAEEPKPLIIFLHGQSLCGNNLDRVRRYGTIDAIEKGRALDAYVIAPQNPGGAWSPLRVMNVVEYVSSKHNIDPNRIYVIGMSLGGYGTLDMVATYPDKIAAAMAFCGGATVKDLSGLNEVPLWIVHGTADRAVNISESDRVVNAMKAASEDGVAPRLIYNRIPGMNHGGPARLLYLADSYDWLMSHSLTDEDREVSEPFAINSTTLRGAYDGLVHKSSSHRSYTKRKGRHRRASATASSKKSKKSSAKKSSSKSKKSKKKRSKK